MAKKAAKKDTSAAKAKKVAKPAAAKKAVKAVKPAPAKKSEKNEKPLKAAPKAVKAEKIGKLEKAAPNKKVADKKASQVAVSVSEKPKKTAEEVSEIVSEAPNKKEKKVKINKTGLSEDQLKWHEFYEKYKGVKAPLYSISAQYEAKTPIQHKIFGWGFILSNEYDRLEVIFEDGKRMLISNRKLS
ncbi:MAG: hypothetical protein ACXVCY_10290 [Pseudobdellovibrionaceae bacterium]